MTAPATAPTARPDPPAQPWTQRNQRLVAAALDALHARIDGGPDSTAPPAPDLAGTSLDQLVAAFGLTPFERDLLLWCAGSELDSRFRQPTFAEALSTLDCAHWDALATGGALRRWHLVELGPGHALVQRPLRVDERVLHHLIGVPCLDSRLDGVAVPRPDAAGRLTPRQAAVAAQIATDLAASGAGRCVVHVDGADARTRLRVAGHAAASLDRVLLEIPGERLAAARDDVTLLTRLVERESALLGALPYVPLDQPDRAVTAFVDALGCPVLVGGAAAGSDVDLHRTVATPDADEQRDLWLDLLYGHAVDGETLARVCGSFRFQVPDVEAVAREIAREPATRLHHACRVRARAPLADLAEPIEPRASWADVVLPEASTATLRDIGAHVRNRARVYDEWGMAASSSRGLGVTALFTGEPGTGKTLAAEVLAAELDLDLYRIDLAGVVSKYIGETEKNLKRVFDAADASGAVLLFDEADAIFGKRSEIRDSHDRYANLEISYLLQRMETYRGLALLTTNLRSALDRSFLRRIRFVVTFPFPDAAARERIWRLQFPPGVPRQDLNWSRLARLQLPGGHIRSIALGAAFLAADAGEPVTMAHLLAATRREYAKLEKPLTEAEIGGWGA